MGNAKKKELVLGYGVQGFSSAIKVIASMTRFRRFARTLCRYLLGKLLGEDCEGKKTFILALVVAAHFFS